jgi:HKD family nuclease
MEARIIDNVSVKMSTVLPHLIESSRDIRVAVAFVSRQGISLIERALDTALAAGGTAEFLVGLDMRSTEPQAVRWLLDRTRGANGIELHCYAALTDAGIYHPKLYLARSGEEVSFVVGSSNLTDGGLRKNVEVNVLIEADTQDEIVSDVYSTYSRLKFHPERVIPDDEFVAMYAELCRRERQARADPALVGLTNEFKRKAATLRRPKPSRRDLVGWLELVYDAVPEGEFTNADAYSFEAKFQEAYPDNQNIRAKVRQQLQVLAQMGLVEDVARGKWRKLLYPRLTSAAGDL